MAALDHPLPHSRHAPVDRSAPVNAQFIALLYFHRSISIGATGPCPPRLSTAGAGSWGVESDVDVVMGRILVLEVVHPFAQPTRLHIDNLEITLVAHVLIVPFNESPSDSQTIRCAAEGQGPEMKRTFHRLLVVVGVRGGLVAEADTAATSDVKLRRS